MTTPCKIAIQQPMLPGQDLDETFHNAVRYGFDGVELAVAFEADLELLVREVEEASRRNGIVVSSICTTREHDPLQPDLEERTRRLAVLTELVAAADALGAAGIVSVPLRRGLGAYEGTDPAAAIAALTDAAVDALGSWAASLPAGNAALFLEPLNRYEARFLTRVGQAVEIARRVGSPRVQALGDLFHMNIEEANPAAALREAGPLLGHVHLADNTRMLPGAGALDFRPPFAALQAIDYRGWMALECVAPAGQMLMPDPERDAPAAAAFLREQWEAAARGDQDG